MNITAVVMEYFREIQSNPNERQLTHAYTTPYNIVLNVFSEALKVSSVLKNFKKMTMSGFLKSKIRFL